MHITTLDEISGYKITKNLGLVRGSTVRARNAGADFLAGVKMFIGGEIAGYTKLLADAREQAIQRMIDDAKSLGADAIVGVRFGTSQVMQGSAEILVYGTAVKLEEINNSDL